MRDRLRTRLKSKKSEFKSLGDQDELLSNENHNSSSLKRVTTNQLNQTKSTELNQKKDDRDLDELLKFINMNEEANTKEKKNKKKKEKKKKKNLKIYSHLNEDCNQELVNDDQQLIEKECVKQIDKQIKKSIVKQTNKQIQRHDKLANSSSLNNQQANGQVEACGKSKLKRDELTSDHLQTKFIPNYQNNVDKNLALKTNKKQSNKKSTRSDKKLVVGNNKKIHENVSANCNGQQQRYPSEKSSFKKSTIKDNLLGKLNLEFILIRIYKFASNIT